MCCPLNTHPLLYKFSLDRLFVQSQRPHRVSQSAKVKLCSWDCIAPLIISPIMFNSFLILLLKMLLSLVLCRFAQIFSQDVVLSGTLCRGVVAPGFTGCHQELCR